jgi:hypothetical protein
MNSGSASNLPSNKQPSLGERLQEVIECSVERFRVLLQSVFSSAPTDPVTVLELETRLHQAVSRECLDPIVGAAVQALHNQNEVIERADLLVLNRLHLRLQKSEQTVLVTFLGGSKIPIVTPYCLHRPPKRRGRPRRKGSRGREGNGVYPILAVLGIHQRVSPAFWSEVARLAASTTVDQTVKILSLRGVQLDRKVVSRLADRLARRGLEYREWLQQRTLEGYRGEGKVKGKRLVIGTDGGRLRTRVYPKQGRRRPSGWRGFEAPWREPKVLVIYEIDSKGRKLHHGVLRYDATLQDADGLFAILTSILADLGADEATEWVFIADGADWIWDRVEKLAEALNFSMDKVTQVLDFYHASEHLHAIAAEVKGWSIAQQKAWVQPLKRHLRNGDIDKIIAAGEQLCRGRNAKEIKKRVNYFRTHRHLMAYKEFKHRRIPLGSGAIESCVRRLVNLRLKGNGIFWIACNAEGILHLRAQLLSGRWQDFIETVLQPQDFWASANPLLAAPEATLELAA